LVFWIVTLHSFGSRWEYFIRTWYMFSDFIVGNILIVVFWVVGCLGIWY
jgi:hypothetical protein